jgi:cysteinyl-tRNA synthetase
MFMNGWNHGIEITDDMKIARNSFESYVTNFFLRVKDLEIHPNTISTSPNDAEVSEAFQSAQKKMDEKLCNSFDTALVLRAIQDLVSEWNNGTG